MGSSRAARAAAGLAVLAFGGGAPAPAAASRSVVAVRGDVKAIAFSGEAIIVARRPDEHGLVVERIVPGSPARTILRLPRADGDEVSLAASAEALAVGSKADNDPDRDDFAPSHVLIGPPAGPLREVARCALALDASPVAVAGAGVAWGEGLCWNRSQGSISPSVIAIGGASPAAAVRRIPLGSASLLLSLLLASPDRGLAGLQRPAPSTTIDTHTEIRPFAPVGLGEPVVSELGRVIAPIGMLADGSVVLISEGDEDLDACGPRRVETIGPAGRRNVALGSDCVLADITAGLRAGAGPVATGDRIIARLGAPLTAGGLEGPIDVVSVRADGADRRVLTRGSYRRPLGVAADGARVAWWQPGCERDRSEVVVVDGPAAAARVASCRAIVRTRTARVRGGRIAVRLACPVGCSGTIHGRLVRTRLFSFGAGTHTLHLRVPLGSRRRARLRLDLSVDNGPVPPTATISVRR